MPAPSRVDLLNRACQGDGAALGELLAECRPYLRVMAERKLDSAVGARIDPSDVVQLTCLEAHRDMPKFRGDELAEFMGWVHRILENNAAQMVQKHIVAQKRTVRKETSLWTFVGLLVLPTPSRRAMRQESAIRLAQALERLPDDQRQAVRLRHLEGKSLAELAASFERSEVAVAGLLKRGLQGLRKHLVESRPAN